MQDNLLLFSNDELELEEKSKEMCGEAESVTAASEVCTFMSKIFKHAKIDASGDVRRVTRDVRRVTCLVLLTP